MSAEVSKLPDTRPSSDYINLVHTLSLSLFKTFFHINFPYKPGLSNVLFISGFPTKTLQEFLLAPMNATHLGHLILLDFFTIALACNKSQSYPLHTARSARTNDPKRSERYNEQFLSIKSGCHNE
jgi:hypothetical protein